MSGIFITFEGIDGCGKSTQADLLENHLKSIRQDVISVREPGGTDISERIREVLLSTDNRMMSKRTEALLLAASRAQLTLETIVPALESGKVVLCDRYLDSTLAYQGYGRQLPVEWLQQINSTAITPDITFYVDIPVDEAMARMKGKTLDRMEEEGTTFLKRVKDGYLTLAQKYSARYIVLDGTADVNSLHNTIRKEIEKKDDKD
ncbi:MAG: dTMP kinase [Candidatus Marinimicrobia bacterium]|jgi:dTMP kinase|nr:dTMP kinase [Candidatus Neomarinimicrobiota bacterium]MDP6593720.1 dTMP kinase [Candidatus Neomarinimicrobiota bacterium]MDP6966210.1 dTMP kinase [Candidatus Neomarinimicrobiota bacterium]|tara:strand:- start:9520 stop:10134 length:615 start_codon:yes stop_codon:yes gene_type:complete